MSPEELIRKAITLSTDPEVVRLLTAALEELEEE
jgi:hypothetical protein